MARERSRRRGEVDLAIGMTLCWLIIAAFTLVVHTTLFPILAATASAGLAWGWALYALRAQSGLARTLRELRALSPERFEEWVAERFRERGYTVRLTGMTGDHGVDLLVVKGGEAVVVQCKHYRKKSVGEPVLRDLYGSMYGMRAQRAYLVTTGHLTRPALAWVQGKPIEVWDGEYLVAQMEREGTGELGNSGTRGN